MAKCALGLSQTDSVKRRINHKRQASIIHDRELISRLPDVIMVSYVSLMDGKVMPWAYSRLLKALSLIHQLKNKANYSQILN